ncbi:MAG: putative aminohydrolase SsnA [Acidobacteria bacterium]|nr:putative aminohydrolase SsnA [Acidobacteriota bacterium]
MAYLLQDATLITLNPVAVERTSLRIRNGRISERGAQLAPCDGEEVLNLGGKIVMAGMVCAHTHLYSALARGMPAPPRSPHNFKEILELIWWRLDAALDEETIYWSALVGALDAARSGTTCLFDHHASPSHIQGSLSIVREALEKVGVRGVLCYEVTDRGGRWLREEGIAENRAFLKSTTPVDRPNQSAATSPEASLFRGLVGAHASFTLADEALEACAALMRDYDAGLHIHVAEDLCDVEDARQQYGLSLLERLAKHDALHRQTILAHGTHLDARDLQMAREAGVWLAHNPRSNMNNQVGYAPTPQFGARVVLGTDGIGADLFAETQFAFFKGRDAQTPFSADHWLGTLANNQRLATEIFGVELGALDTGAAADLMVLNYPTPTPINAENFAWHFVFGMNSATVDSVMVNGDFIMRNRQSRLDEERIYEQARRATAKLWAKLQRS